MLSPKVQEELLEASSHLRAALRNASTNERPLVCKQIANILVALESIEQTENLMNSLESFNLGGDNPFFRMNP